MNSPAWTPALLCQPPGSQSNASRERARACLVLVRAMAEGVLPTVPPTIIPLTFLRPFFKRKAATKSPCPVHRAEAQSAQRKNFAKNAQFFGIALLQRSFFLLCTALRSVSITHSRKDFFAQRRRENQARRFCLVFLCALCASARDVPSARFWAAVGRAASPRLRVSATLR
jgi:hypothetical protein